MVILAAAVATLALASVALALSGAPAVPTGTTSRGASTHLSVRSSRAGHLGANVTRSPGAHAQRHGVRLPQHPHRTRRPGASRQPRRYVRLALDKPHGPAIAAGPAQWTAPAADPLVVPAVQQLTGTPLSKSAEEAKLVAPEEVRLREESQTKFEGMNPGQAATLAGESFPELIDQPDGGPPRLPTGESITGYPADNAAQVELAGGGHVIVESLGPMAIETAPGHREPVDLTPSQNGRLFAPARSPVGVSIGSRSGEGAMLTDSDVSLTPLDERGHPLEGAEGVIVGQSVFYGAVGLDVDEAVKPTDGGFEESSILRSQRSPEQLRFRVGLPAGANLTQESTGAVQVVDEGRMIARVLRPFAEDAAGTPVPVTMSISGDVLILTVARPSERYRYPIAVDPELEDTGLAGGNKSTTCEYPGPSGAEKKSTNWRFGPGGNHFCSRGWGESTLYLEPIHYTSWGPGETGELSYETKGVSKIYAAELNSSGVAEGGIETYMRLAHGSGASEEEDNTGPLDGPAHAVSYPKATYSLCAAFKASGDKEISCPGPEGSPWQYAAEGNRASVTEAVTCASYCDAEGTLQGTDYAALYHATVFVYQPETATPSVEFNELSPQVYNGHEYVRNLLFSCQKYNETYIMLKIAIPCISESSAPDYLGPDAGAIEVQAEDPGVGVSALEVFATNGAFEIKRHYKEEGKCSGIQCPEGIGVTKGESPLPGETITYNPSMPEGEMTIAAHAEDSAGLHAPAALAHVIVDAKPPKIRVGGALNGEELGTGESKLKVEATSGEGTTKSAGVREIKVEVDKHQLGTVQGHCEPGPCTAIGEWPIAGRNYAAGKHELTVTAVDNANNVRKEEFPFWVHPATPLPAGPGQVNPSSGEFTLSATDVSLGSGLGVSRTYASRHLTLGAEGPLGPQWGLSLGGQETLAELPEGSIILNSASGGEALFDRTGTNEYESPRGDQNLKLEAKEEKGAISAYVLKDPKDGTATTFKKPTGWAPTPTYSTVFGAEGSSSGEFKVPTSLAVDGEGNLWVTDYENGRVEEFSPEHVFIRSVGSKGTGEGQFEAPWGIAVNQKSDLVYVSDQGSHRVDIFTVKGRFVSSFTAGKGPAFGTLAGVAVDESGNVWVCDYSNDRIDEFSETGEYELSIAPETLHALSGPTNIAFSGGNLYVTNQGSHDVEELNTKGEWQRTIGSEGKGNGEFSDPYGIATDPENGDLFVSDAAAHRVQEFSPEGTFLTKFGAEGSAAEDFSEPLGVALNSDGAVYIADAGVDQIKEWEVPQERSVWLPTIAEGTVPSATQTYSYRATEVEGKQVIEPTEELAPQAKGTSSKPVECVGRPKEAGAKFTAGCRALFFEYDTTETKATGEEESEWGVYKGHLSEVVYAAYNPATKAVEEKPLARYLYDSKGRLRAEWDPRIEPSLKTIYGYDEEGHVTAMTPPGQQPWTFTYGSAPGDENLPGDINSGRLLKYRRASALTPAWNGSAPTGVSCKFHDGVISCHAGEGLKLEGPSSVGTRIAGSHGSWSNSPAAYAFQWEDCNAQGEGCVPIAGATNENYTPRTSDVTHTLRAAVTATNSGGSSTVLSEASAEVTGMPAPAYSQSIGKEGSEAGELSSPHAIARDANGHLWVADTANNRIEELSESGTMVRQISSFKAKPGSSEVQERLLEPAGVAVDGHGDVWAVAQIEGLHTYYVVEFSETGEWMRQFTCSASCQSLLFDGEIAIDKSTDNVYVSAVNGGVEEFTEQGEFLREFHSCSSGVSICTSPLLVRGIAVDKSGDVWVASLCLLSSYCWGVEEFSAEGSVLRTLGGEALPGGGEVGFPGEGGGQFDAPTGIAVDESGRVWVADTGNHRVQVFNATGEYLAQFGTKGTGAGQLEEPVAIAPAPNGEAWVLDHKNDDIERWKEGASASQASPQAPQPGSTIDYDVPVSGQAAARVGASFHASGFSVTGPMASTVDTHGDIWAVGLGDSAENGPGMIDEYTPTGQRLHAIATGACLPTNISADRSGDVWVTEVMCAKIQEYNFEGRLLKQFFASSGEGKLSFPVGVATDGKGDVYDVNWASGAERVWKLSESGTYLGPIGESGTGPGDMSDPRGVAVEEDGDLWVADMHNDRVDEFEPSGAFVKAVGYGVVDGKAKLETCTNATGCRAGIAGADEGQLSSPMNVAVDSEGHVFVADSGNARIEEFSSESGAYIGQIGSHQGGLDHPTSVGIAPSGSVWVSDETTGRLSEYELSLSPAGAPHAMGEAEVAAWAQRGEEAPVEATAIFPPDELQGWPASDYRRATITYLDSRGRPVNVASPSGGISTAEYNEDNEVERSLSPDNRVTALEAGEKAPEVSERLATDSVYNFEGTELLQTLGPEHKLKLAAKLGSHEAGEDVSARSLTRYGYDEGHPSGEEYGLETKVRQGLLLASGETGEERETTTGYSGQNGLGWKLRQPTSVTSDPAGLSITHSTVYYAGAEEPGAPACGKHPELEGFVCETRGPRGQGAAGKPEFSYSTQFGYEGSGEGQFQEPVGTALDGEGNVWVLRLR